jgi:hypothetical protein
MTTEPRKEAAEREVKDAAKEADRAAVIKAAVIKAVVIKAVVIKAVVIKAVVIKAVVIKAVVIKAAKRNASPLPYACWPVASTVLTSWPRS